MASHVQWKTLPSAEQLAATVVADVASVITDAVHARGRAVVAFPGGKTPLPMLEALAALPLPWPQVTIIPTDDRLVPVSSVLSNVAVLTRLFDPLGATVLALGGDAVDYWAAGRAADAELQALPWPLDLVWLGMGGDGHTASIFVGPDLERAMAPSAGVRAVGLRPDPLPPEAPVNRVTLTGPAIAAARRVMLLITGAEKVALLERALAEGETTAYPVGRVLAAAETSPVVYCTR
jgi:6-phosphogluconolactonase